MTIAMSSTTAALSAERRATMTRRSVSAGAERATAVVVMIAGILAAAGTALAAMVSL